MTISLLMIDADTFKAFNDRFGHQAGDEALKDIAGCLRRGVTGHFDLVARYGGEEFVVLMPGTPAAKARQLAESLRHAVEQLILPEVARSWGRLTISIGVGFRVPENDDEAWKLVSDADRALYLAKALGRNRVSSSSASRLTLVSSKGMSRPRAG